MNNLVNYFSRFVISDVIGFRLLTRNTYEREMFDKASLKLGLDKAVLQSMNTTQGGKDYGGSGKQPLSKKEIEDLLKKGAYGALMEDDNAGDKFCEEDIDQILMRRTQIITLESEKGSQFSKATFASNSDRTDIDIDDPDFWKKWAKRAEIDTDTILTNGQEELLVLSEPRRRTQIKRYGQVLNFELEESFVVFTVKFCVNRMKLFWRESVSWRRLATVMRNLEYPPLVLK
jgi:chromodomain-helicase-DNA-binding protein 7